MSVEEVLPRRLRVSILFGLLIALVGCDQATKKYAVDYLKGRPEQVYLDGYFRIKYAENPGAFLSLFANMSPQVRFTILTLGNGFVLAGFLAFLIWGQPDRWMFSGLSLIVVGGIGNLIDRIRLGGRVIDFLILGKDPPIQTGVFNVADMAITAGFIILLPMVLMGDPKSKEPATVPASPTPVPVPDGA